MSQAKDCRETGVRIVSDRREALRVARLEGVCDKERARCDPVPERTHFNTVLRETDILVDRCPWYPPALEHLGLRYKQVTFGERCCGLVA